MGGRVVRAWVAAVVVVAAAEAAAAQDPPNPLAGDGMTPGQVQQLFDAMLVMQAQEALTLNETQHAQFLTRLRALQEVRRRAARERLRLIGELQRLTNARNPRPNVRDADLKPRLAALQELESRQAGELRRAYDAIDEILDTFQQARFRVLEEQIERRKLELVGRARQNNPNRPPAARRPPGR
jgi:hypothetical protein